MAEVYENPFRKAVEPDPDRPVGKQVELMAWPDPNARKPSDEGWTMANLTRAQKFDMGLITVADLDDEEIRRGQVRDEYGKFGCMRTAEARKMSRTKYEEYMAEHMRRNNNKIRSQMDAALMTMIDIMNDDTVEPRDRFEAAKYIFERSAGKTPDRVAVTVSKAPWEEMFSGIAKTKRRSRRDTVDAEVVDEQPVVDDEPEIVVQQQTMQPEQSPVEQLGILDADLMGDLRITPPTNTPGMHDPESNNPVVEQSNSEMMREAREAQIDLAERRKAAKERIQGAKKQRIIKRNLGVNGLQNNKIDMTPGDDGKLKFNLKRDDPSTG